MTKFYYSSVSNSAKKRITGTILAENEKEAREKLNKVGMAILSITTGELADWKDENAFEFSVIQKNDEEFSGEILAENEDEVFDRLAEEFNFKRINYICRSNASEEEKMKARESAVKEIIFRQRQQEEERSEMEKRTLSGGLKTLVKMGSKENDEDGEERLRLENLKKFSDEGEEDLTKKTAADVADHAKPDADQIKKINFSKREGESSFQSETVDVVEEEGGEGGEEEEKEEKKSNIRKKIKELQEKFKNFLPRFTERAGDFYFLLTEIVVPPKDKTRQKALQEMRLFLFPPKVSDDFTIEKKKNEAIMMRKAILERFWIALEEIVDVLAAVFLVYFAIGALALYVYIPRITSLAEQTLSDNVMIPFLAGVFIFIRLLILLREKFTSWSPLRTSILFLFGGLVIVFTGMNLL